MSGEEKTVTFDDVEMCCKGETISLVIRMFTEHLDGYDARRKDSCAGLQNDAMLVMKLLARLFGEYSGIMQPVAEDLARRMLSERAWRGKATA